MFLKRYYYSILKIEFFKYSILIFIKEVNWQVYKKITFVLKIVKKYLSFAKNI